MTVLDTQLNARSADFQANAAAMRAVVDDLKAQIEKATLGGGTAARAKHQVIMTPHAETYFNYMQHRVRKGPGHTGYLPLLKVYHFDPLRGLTPEEAKYVLGGQGCLWTEYVPATSDVEYLLFPRLFAMAEVLWSLQGDRSDADFLTRVAPQTERLKKAGIRYCDGGEK